MLVCNQNWIRHLQNLCILISWLQYLWNKVNNVNKLRPGLKCTKLLRIYSKILKKLLSSKLFDEFWKLCHWRLLSVSKWYAITWANDDTIRWRKYAHTVQLIVSWHRNVFHIMGLLSRESTSDQWFPLTMGQLCRALKFSLILAWTNCNFTDHGTRGCHNDNLFTAQISVLSALWM